MKPTNEQQIVITLLTHEKLKQMNQLYDTPQSPVPTREVHLGLEVGSAGLKMDNLSIFIPADYEYVEYLKLITYAAQNPISKEVFERAKTHLQKEVPNV